MRKPTSVDVVGAALVTALGLLGGCGGIASRSSGDDGGASSDEGGAQANPVPGSPAQRPAATAPSATTCTAHPCMNPTPLIVANVDTGYDSCADGVLRRRAIVDCPVLVPRSGALSCMTLSDGGAYPGTCIRDSDCTEHPLGACILGNPPIPGNPCSCKYGCVRDSDCGNNEICFCDDPVGSCKSSSCSSGKDCQPGCDCVGVDVQANWAFQCQTPQDTCLTSGDCVDAGDCCEPANFIGSTAPLSCTDQCPRISG